MSKIGQRQIIIPEGINLVVNNQIIKVIGNKGELTLNLPEVLYLEKDNQTLKLRRQKNDKTAKSLQGLYHKLIRNMLEGVSQGFEKKLEFKGIGYRAETDGKKITLQLGFSHPIVVEATEGISYKVEKNIITVSGIDRQKVGQAAAEIRLKQPVEPYKGKGIKYIDEISKRKPGKTAKTTLGTTS